MDGWNSRPRRYWRELERYAASVRERGPARNGSPAAAVAGVPAAPRRVAAVDTLTPSARRTPTGESAAQWMRFLGEVSPGLLATGSCVLVILLFERLGHVFAVVTATVLMLVAAVGLLRRVPCAGALAFGVIIAGLLIRVS